MQQDYVRVDLIELKIIESRRIVHVTLVLQLVRMKANEEVMKENENLCK